MVRTMCRFYIKDRETADLGFNETTYLVAMVNSVRWYVHVLRREDVHVLKRSFDFKIEVQIKKGRYVT